MPHQKLSDIDFLTYAKFSNLKALHKSLILHKITDETFKIRKTRRLTCIY